MKVFDQLGNEIEINGQPGRVVSLVPSITELLIELGLGNKVVGRSKYCIEPKGLVESIPTIGGTKNVDIEQVLTLNPDLIIANKEENTKEQIYALRKNVPVWVSNVITFQDAMDLIEKLGELFDVIDKSQDLLNKIRDAKKNFEENIVRAKYYNKSVIYFIWRKPYMVVGKNTFINSMLEVCSLHNLAYQLTNCERYPKVEKSELSTLVPDLVFLSTEPYPFADKHIAEFQEIFPHSEIKIVRGDYFSWYGSRIMKSFDYFKELFVLRN
jgi:ABC-type Fe3+-hydroxamate transport system substrate-binding protein